MANSFCFRSLSCPAAAIFPNCPFQYFPSVPCFSFDPLASIAFSDTSLSKICCTRPFSDLDRNSPEPVSQLTCPDFFAEGKPELSEGKGCFSNALSQMDFPGCTLLSATYAQNRRMYITCNIYFERLECFKLLVTLKTALFKYCTQADISK